MTQLNWLSILLRLSLAAICGGVIGVERGLKNKPAGLRTHILVCLGSAMSMIVGQYLTTLYPYSDPGRLGAQVISGIGFLGAGTIIVTSKMHVTGLTTAAGLWASACMGLAAGIGFYEGAIVACLFIYVVMTLLHRLDEHVMSKSQVIVVYVGIAPGGSFTHLMEQFREYGWTITNIEPLQEHGPDQGTGAILTIKTFSKTDHSLVMERIAGDPDILFVYEI